MPYSVKAACSGEMFEVKCGGNFDNDMLVKEHQPANEEDVNSDCGNQISFRADLEDKMVLKDKNSVSRSNGSGSLFDTAGHKFVLKDEPLNFQPN